jgi:hypothetical protein
MRHERPYTVNSVNNSFTEEAMHLLLCAERLREKYNCLMMIIIYYSFTSLLKNPVMECEIVKRESKQTHTHKQETKCWNC